MFTTEVILISSIVLLLLIVVGSMLFFKLRSGRPRRKAAEGSPAVLDGDEADIGPVLASELTLNSIESLEFADEENEAPVETNSSPAPAIGEEVEVDASGLEDVPRAEEKEESTPVPEEIGEEAASEEIDSETETEIPTVEKIEPLAETPSPAAIEADASETIPANNSDDINVVAEITAEAKEIHVEVESLAAAKDEDVRRATLRRAPLRQRKPRRADENLDKEISDLDHRLDALEALVSSIEESLADFEPLLDEVDTDAELIGVANGDDQAQAA